jgi:MFS family permease
MELRSDKAWLAWLPLAAIYFFSVFPRVAAPTTTFNDLLAEFSCSGAAVAGLGAMYFYVYGLMQVPTGILADAFGPKRVAVTGGFLIALGSIGFSQAPNLFLLYAARFFVALGSGLVFISVLKSVDLHFPPARFATLTAATTAIGGAGALAASVPFAYLVRSTSWRTGIALSGCACLAFCVLAAVFVTGKGAHAKHRPTQPLRHGIVAAFSNPRTYPPLLVNLGIFIQTYLLQGNIGSKFFEDRLGWSSVRASQQVFLLTLGILAGVFSVGFLSDRVFRRRKPVILLFAILGVPFWATIVLSTLCPIPSVVLTISVLAIGLSNGCPPLNYAVAREVNNPRTAGLSMGIANTAGMVASAMAINLSGFLLDWGGFTLASDGKTKVFSSCAYMLVSALGFAAAIGASVAAFFVTETGNMNVWQAHEEKRHD